MVYVDSINLPYGRMTMCHMMADTTEELLQMADKIGVQRKWIQYPGTVFEHFDVCASKKKLALAAGAKQITLREAADLLKERRKKGLPEKKNKQQSNA
jgi:hypothetical protein